MNAFNLHKRSFDTADHVHADMPLRLNIYIYFILLAAIIISIHLKPIALCNCRVHLRHVYNVCKCMFGVCFECFLFYLLIYFFSFPDEQLNQPIRSVSALNTEHAIACQTHTHTHHTSKPIRSMFMRCNLRICFRFGIAQ